MALNLTSWTPTDLDFPDNSFDAVLLFEVLEHVDDPASVLDEAKRVAKKVHFITVPNCSGFFDLKRLGLTYDHFVATIMLIFFTKEDLENLLSKNFNKFKVEEKEALALGAINLPWILKYPILALYKLKIIKSSIYYRLYCCN